MLFHP
jgi:hypothetical protein